MMQSRDGHSGHTGYALSRKMGRSAISNHFTLQACLCVSVHAWCLWCHKRMSDLLELELHTVMSCHVGSGNELRSSGKAASDVNCWAISSDAPTPCTLADYKDFERKKKRHILFVPKSNHKEFSVFSWGEPNEVASCKKIMIVNYNHMLFWLIEQMFLLFESPHSAQAHIVY